MSPAGKPITGRFVLVSIVVFFGTILAVNGIMMRYAISTMPGVEVESAYSASLAYQKDIANAHRQDQRDWKVSAHVMRDARDGKAAVEIEAREANGQPIKGLVIVCRLERPADRRADVEVELHDRGNGIYRGEAGPVAPGQWMLKIESRQDGQRIFASSNRVVLDHD